MSRLKLPYWEADEKLSWICLRHRTDIIHTTDGRSCAFCPRTKKLTRPIYIISYRIALTYYMTEGKFLDIGRGVCQSCRHKTFKSLDFHDCPVVTPNELASSETIGSSQQASSSSHLQAALSSTQLPGQHSRILSAREEKPINLPTNPAVPSIKIKSLAAIQPVLNSTKQSSNGSQLNRSVSLANQIYPMRGGDGQHFYPMRVQQGRNVGTAVPQNFDNVRNKISDLNTAIHTLNPRYRPLGFSITKLSDLGPSTLLETLTATHIAMETILSSIAPGQEKELWEAVLPYMTTKLINK